MSAESKTVVTTVTEGRGSVDEVGRKSQYTKTCPGENSVKSSRFSGLGSHTLTSHTSLCSSGCALDAAVVAFNTEVKYRRGEEDIGEESTRTRRADGVEGG